MKPNAKYAQPYPRQRKKVRRSNRCMPHCMPFSSASLPNWSARSLPLTLTRDGIHIMWIIYSLFFTHQNLPRDHQNGIHQNQYPPVLRIISEKYRWRVKSRHHRCHQPKQYHLVKVLFNRSQFLFLVVPMVHLVVAKFWLKIKDH
jgi:hypothetical protein